MRAKPSNQQVTKVLPQQTVDPAQRQAHHVVEVALDALDEQRAVVVLNAIGPGFVERGASGDVGVDLRVAERAERDLRGLGGVDRALAGEVVQRDARIDRVRSAREVPEHPLGVVCVCRLFEHAAV